MRIMEIFFYIILWLVLIVLSCFLAGEIIDRIENEYIKIPMLLVLGVFCSWVSLLITSCQYHYKTGKILAAISFVVNLLFIVICR